MDEPPQSHAAISTPSPESHAAISTPSPESHAEISAPRSTPAAPRPLPPERHASRRRRRGLIAGAALLLVLAAGWLVIRILSPTHRSIVGVAPLGEGEALLLTRHVDGSDRTSWIELVRSDGKLVWRRDVSPLEPTEAAGFSGVAAAPDRVIVIGAQQGGTAVKAFSRASGEVLWQTLVAEGVVPQRAGPALHVEGPRVYAVHTRATGGQAAERITALSLERGESLWTMDLPSTSTEVVVLGPRRLLVAARGPLSDGGVDEVDGVTGSVLRALPMSRIACTTAHGVIGFDLRQGVALLRPPTPAGDGAAELTQLDRNAAAGPCGTRGDDIVFGARSEEDGRRRHGLMRLEPVKGRLRWELDLGAVSFAANETVDGALPRFLPVAVTEAGASKVVVVDLDTGARVSEHPTSGGVTALVSADRGWVVTGATLVALDPSTGELGHASAIPEVLGRGALAREDLRFGALWMTGSDRERAPSDLPWLAVDLSTGRLLHANGDVAPRDVTSSGWPAP